MLMELESNQLTVILVPQRTKTNDGGMIRVASSKNCNWYRKFCAKFLSSRKRTNRCVDTRIKRFRTVDALQKMLAGQPSTYYFVELNRIARNWKTI